MDKTSNIILVVLTALIVGMLFIWQESRIIKLESSFNNKYIESINKISKLQRQITITEKDDIKDIKTFNISENAIDPESQNTINENIKKGFSGPHYINEEYGFELQIPDGWYAFEEAAGIVMLLKKNEYDTKTIEGTEWYALGDQINILLINLDNWAGSGKTISKQEYIDYITNDDESIASYEWTTIGNKELLSMTGLRSQGFYYFNDDKIFGFDTFPNNEENLEALNEVISSFNFIN